MEIMQFKVVDSVWSGEINTIYLVNNNWDDWFTYETVFDVVYFDSDGNRKSIGAVKIGQKNQKGRRPVLPAKFGKIGDEFFSLGTSESYYEELKNQPFREEYLKNLNDIAFNLELFSKVIKYDVTSVSLMRDITSSTVKGQFHRMAHGGAKLTDYNFKYILPEKDFIDDTNLEMKFDVEIETMPPTNIHVVIGKNGVGKTTILKRMLYALEIDEEKMEYGKVEGWSCDFSNIVFVSFSAFDKAVDFSEYSGKLPIPYTFVGLVGKDSIKGGKQLAEDFFDSLYKIIKGSKNKLWKDTVDILESDNTFTELHIKDWSEVDTSKSVLNAIKNDNPKTEGETVPQYRVRIERECYRNEIIPKFMMLSSGHKVILLTIAKLVELVEEKTLVLLDEPEEHLHPPLVSAFIRALSNLLIYRNGVGIIATHSPVIVQEVPKKCVWILRRSGKYLKIERPKIETFGENLGELTSEIFGYEVTNSGFHKMLQTVAEKKKTYKGAVRFFHGELGIEARAILKSYMYEKEHTKEEEDD
jgi:predicted ATPase|nr:hypothetical protein [bacterium]